MNPPNRDLLVLTKKAKMNPKDFEHEIQMLNQLLHDVENTETFCMVHEVIDINRYKIIQTAREVKNFIWAQNLKPFIFISNLN